MICSDRPLHLLEEKQTSFSDAYNQTQTIKYVNVSSKIYSLIAIVVDY